MSSVVRISEASTIALHATAIIAAAEHNPVATTGIAEVLGVSQAHLAKVMQRLTRAGLVSSTRGPRGGFTLAKPAKEVSLLDVYEAVEGPLMKTTCLLSKQLCGGQCILGDLLVKVNTLVDTHLRHTSLADLAEVCKNLFPQLTGAAQSTAVQTGSK